MQAVRCGRTRSRPETRGIANLLVRRWDANPIDVALLIPLHGSAGIYGPSSELCAQLAAEEVNADGGVLGRELRLRVVDASGPPARIGAVVHALVTEGEVEAVVGWHISAVRNAVAPRIAGL